MDPFKKKEGGGREAREAFLMQLSAWYYILLCGTDIQEVCGSVLMSETWVFN